MTNSGANFEVTSRKLRLFFISRRVLSPLEVTNPFFLFILYLTCNSIVEITLKRFDDTWQLGNTFELSVFATEHARGKQKLSERNVRLTHPTSI